MDPTWERRLGPIAIAMHDQRCHRRSVNALPDRGPALKPELVVDNEVIGQGRMGSHRDAVQQRHDRVAESGAWLNLSGVAGLGDLDAGGDALRPDVHDRLEACEPIGGALNDPLHGCDRQID